MKKKKVTHRIGHEDAPRLWHVGAASGRKHAHQLLQLAELKCKKRKKRKRKKKTRNGASLSATVAVAFASEWTEAYN